MRARPLPIATAFLVAALAAPPARATPEIFGLNPTEGPAGTRIQVTGKDLGQTRNVAFAVGSTVKSAAFKVIGNDRLEVTAPEYYREGGAATVAVFTAKGVTVGMPAAGRTINGPIPGAVPTEPGASLLHVLPGGVVNDAETVAVIERGGVVEDSRRPAMHFVRNGGVLLRFNNAYGLIVREVGANFGPDVVNRQVPLTVITVPTITLSPGVGPFLYTKPPVPKSQAAATPPVIRSVSPIVAGPGDILLLRGKGFARTTNVFLSGRARILQDAGFRVISDDQLRIQIPDQNATPGPQIVIVATSEGATVTLPPRGTEVRMEIALNPFNPRINPVDLPYLLVGPGEVVRFRGAHVYYVAGGGLVAGTGGGGVYFVKSGGEMADPGANPSALFYEPEAIVPQRLKEGAGKNIRQVRAIVPSPINGELEVVTTPRYVN